MTENAKSPGDKFLDCVVALVRDGALASTRMVLERDARLYNIGDRDNHVFLVEHGRVKTCTVSHDGKDCLLGLYGPSELFGELCVLHTGRTEAASAMKRSVVRRMSANELLRVLQRRNLLEQFVVHMAARVAEQQELIRNFVTMNSEQRLAARILQLARHEGRRHRSGLRIEERITQEEFASMVGTTRSRVGYFLKGFADAGMVQRTRDWHLLVEEERMVEYLRSGPESR